MSVYNLVIIITFVMVVLIVHNLIGGSFGVRQMTKRCFGLTLDEQRVTKYLPSGDYQVRNEAVYIKYYVPTEANNDAVYCLGQDIWFK